MKWRKFKSRLNSAIHDTPWSIHPPAFSAIQESLLELHDGGEFALPLDAGLGFSVHGDQQTAIVGGVGLLHLTGVLTAKENFVTRFLGGTATQTFEQNFKRFLADSEIKAIGIICDSPGGEARGSEELAQTIYSARGVKPIASFVRGFCASACYYIASAADTLIASPSSAIGSVGVIMQHVEFSQAFKEMGVAWNLITFGENKKDGNTVEPLAASAKKNLQAFIDSYGNQFVSAVARHRGVSEKQVMDQYGQGRVFIASEALRLGMIDSVASQEAFISQLSASQASQSNATQTTAAVIPAASTISADPTALNSPGAGESHVSNTSDVGSAKMEDSAVTFSKNLKAACYLQKLVKADSVEIAMVLDDTVIEASLTAFFAVKGQNCPAGEEEIIAAIMGKNDKPAATGAAANATPQTQTVPKALTAAEVEAAEEAAVAADRLRRDDILASARVLGISAEEAETAVQSEQSHADITAGWTKKLAADNKPVANDVTVIGNVGAAKFVEAAADALLSQTDLMAPGTELSAEAKRLSQAGFSWIAARTLEYCGERVSDFDAKEDVALRALQMDPGIHVLGAASYLTPGSFPNLLSNLSGKILNSALLLSEATYPRYTAKMSDAADFKPKTLMQMGHFDELDVIKEGHDADQIDIDEELASWIQIDRFGNSVGLTPRMVADDDLDSFEQGLRSLSIAHEQTLNRLCLRILTGNATMLDGNKLFDASNHGNIVPAGGAPSSAQANEMRRLLRLQRGVGDKGLVRTGMGIALVPAQHEDAAMQTFLKFSELNESKLAVTDATINTHRGSVTPVVEPELDAKSITIWYGLVSPAIRRTIVHMFQKGYGRNGKRTTWFDPGKETRMVKLEGRFAAAAAGWRGIVQNPGV